ILAQKMLDHRLRRLLCGRRVLELRAAAEHADAGGICGHDLVRPCRDAVWALRRERYVDGPAVRAPPRLVAGPQLCLHRVAAQAPRARGRDVEHPELRRTTTVR